MGQFVSINCDMAESFGAYTIGNDGALLKSITTANVACGFHAGDPTVMHDFVLAAAGAKVSIGAHPGFSDLQGFGRRPIHMKPAEVEYMVAYQIGALQALARYAGLRITHVKPHGALANMAAKDAAYAEAIARAIKVVDNSLIYLVLYRSEMHKAGERLGLAIAREGYADRLYEDDGNLAARSVPGAVIADPQAAAAQAVRMARDGEIVARSGRRLEVQIDSICVHGDEPSAVPVAAAVRAGLEAAGIAVLPLDQMPLHNGAPVAVEHTPKSFWGKVTAAVTKESLISH